VLFVFADLGVFAQQHLIDLPGFVSRKVAKVRKDERAASNRGVNLYQGESQNQSSIIDPQFPILVFNASLTHRADKRNNQEA